jgi:hypothetical protein
LLTAIWVWFQEVGFQAVVVWQAVQFRVLGIWDPGFPVAELPLWQDAQFVAAVKPLWSIPVAGNQALVLWQVPQAAWVGRCPEGFPAVMLPLWQLLQLLLLTPTWSNRAPPNELVVWQLSQVS